MILPPPIPMRIGFWNVNHKGTWRISGTTPVLAIRYDTDPASDEPNQVREAFMIAMSGGLIEEFDATKQIEDVAGMTYQEVCENLGYAPFQVQYKYESDEDQQDAWGPL